MRNLPKGFGLSDIEIHGTTRLIRKALVNHHADESTNIRYC